MRSRAIQQLAIKPGSATDRTRPYRRRLFPILVLGALLLGSRTPAATESTHDLFEQFEVVTGTAKGQTVFPGFFLGGDVAELAVVHIDEKNDRRLRLYAVDDATGVPRLDATLGRAVLFVDVANIGGRDRLITYERGRLNWFDPESATEHPLMEVATSYNATPSGLHYGGAEPTGPFDEGEIPRVDITRDLNRDGRDDLVLPDVDGFWIATQMSDGSFTDPVKLGPPEPFRDAFAFDERRSYGEVGITALTIPWYLSRVHQMDYNRDGRSDLVFWNEDHFDVHLQDERGLFEPVAETFTTDVPFDSDGVYSLMFGSIDKSTFALIFGFGAKIKRTVLHSFHDVNGDRVADLVTLALSGRSLLRQRSVYEVYFGTPTPEGTVFAPDVSTAVRPQGRAPVGYSSQWFQDFDGDGQVDIAHGHVKTGFGGMIRALLGTSITLSSELYRLEDGIYPDKPTTARKIRSDIDIRGGRDAGFWPAVLVGDVNGDGRSDVLVGKSRDELRVFLGVPGPALLARQPHKVAVALPGDERNSWLVDLNKDSKQDVLLHRASTTEPHRVTMLIAREAGSGRPSAGGSAN